MRIPQKRLAVALGALCILASLLFAFLLSDLANHDCDDDCEICIQMAHLAETAKQLGTALPVVALFVALYPICTALLHRHETSSSITPVALKVQLNS